MLQYTNIIFCTHFMMMRVSVQRLFNVTLNNWTLYALIKLFTHFVSEMLSLLFAIDNNQDEKCHFAKLPLIRFTALRSK